MNDMVYVAEDRKQPGAAYAIMVDDARYPKDIAETLADWVMRGAIVQRVDVATGRAMLTKWVRLGKQQEIDA